MKRGMLLRALAVVTLGSAALFQTPTEAMAGGFECGWAVCIPGTNCYYDQQMKDWCEFHGCITDLYNCGELGTCSGNKRLWWCGEGVES